jgi:transmembrane sensor
MNEPGAVVLTPNQQLTLDQSGKQLTPVVAEPVNPVQPGLEDISLDFDEVALPTVFARLEKLHSVDLVYDETALKDCRLSASLSDEPLFVKLRLICKTMGASYQVINNQIVIQATGCNP